MSSAGAQIYDIRDYLSAKVSTGSQPQVGTPNREVGALTASVENTAQGRRNGARPVSELYPGLSNDSVLHNALTTTSQGIAICSTALELFRAGRHMDADLECMRLPAIAAELFCCRSIGEGLANASDALMTSLRLLAGGPMEAEQILAIKTCLETMHDSPAMSFEESLEVVDILEDSGLRTEPSLGALVGDE